VAEGDMTMHTITPCLWFDSNAEEAVKFYTSIFKNSKVGKIARYGKEGYDIHRRPEGSVLTIEFELNGQPFTALNGGPIFKFNEAISFQVSCKSQKEVDYYWEKLSKGGEKSQCGWLKDRYGVSWQVVPSMLGKMLSGKHATYPDRVMKVLLQMKKLDIKRLQESYKKK
jgi:predicted 3-demethylubiquinone-9 3-methyltransferase (glyoxalase superfamily)